MRTAGRTRGSARERVGVDEPGCLPLEGIQGSLAESAGTSRQLHTGTCGRTGTTGQAHARQAQALMSKPQAAGASHRRRAQAAGGGHKPQAAGASHRRRSGGRYRLRAPPAAPRTRLAGREAAASKERERRACAASNGCLHACAKHRRVAA